MKNFKSLLRNYKLKSFNKIIYWKKLIVYKTSYTQKTSLFNNIQRKLEASKTKKQT